MPGSGDDPGHEDVQRGAEWRHTATMDRYLRDVGRRLGEPVTPEPGAGAAST